MPQAIVIGAGPAGTATALALERAGWDSRIFEAYDQSAGLTQGAFLTVAANGLDALAALGADDAVRDLGFVTRRIRFANHRGKDLGSMPLGTRPDDAPRTVRRADVYSALRERALAAGVAIHDRRRLVDAVPSGTGVTAMFEDGGSETADLLVGADGMRSRMRELIDLDAPEPRPTGLANVGGIAPAGAVPALAAADGDYRMAWGRECFFGYAVDPAGDVWWFANPPKAIVGLPAGAIASELAAMLDGDATPAAAIVRATPGPVSCTEQLELPRVPSWHRDRMVLVGDAAHAVNPSSGQGISMAWEDAALLGLSLERETDVLRALDAYEAHRRARVDRVVRWGKRAGDSKVAGPVASRMRDALFPLFAWYASRERTLRKQSWLHGHHIERDARPRSAA